MNDFASVVNGSVAAAGVLVAYMVYRLSRQNQTESWLRTYEDLHEIFWTDPAIREVRSWLASSPAYEKVKPAFVQRRRILEGEDSADQQSSKDYEALEKMDRFLNFLMRVVAVNPAFEKQRDLWQNLYFGYWLEQFARDDRREICWYVQQFYPYLYKVMRAPSAK